MKGYIPLIALIGLIVVVIIKYNKIIKLKNNRDNSFSDIDVQLQLRFDLVPNLVETVKNYAKHEQETLQKVLEARNIYQNANSVDDKVKANNELTRSLSSIFALSESYPDLKANQNFLELQKELSDIENKIAAARRFFNSATAEYNAYIQMFPNNIIANIFDFQKADMFKVHTQQAKKAPSVKMSS